MVAAAEVATERKAGAQLVATRRRVDALFCDSETESIFSVIRKLTAAGQIITIKFSVLKFEPEEHKELTPNATPFQRALVCLPAQGEG